MEALRSSLNYNHKICIVAHNTYTNTKLKLKLKLKLKRRRMMKTCLFLSNSNPISPLNFSVRAAQVNLDAVKPEGALDSESEVLVWPSPTDNAVKPEGALDSESEVLVWPSPTDNAVKPEGALDSESEVLVWPSPTDNAVKPEGALDSESEVLVWPSPTDNAVKPDGALDSESEVLVWPSPTDKTPFWKRDFPLSHASAESPPDIQDFDLLHIVHITAELAPIAKVGGLGDVVTGLGRACLSRGHKVDIMLPFYECIQRQNINVLELVTTYTSYHDGNWVPTNAYRGIVSDIAVIFIEPSNHFFKGESVYGGSYNELEAYLFFSRACLEWMQITGKEPDIIHVHEWQTGVVPLLYWDMYHYLSLQKPRIVLTIHNMEHYGECSQEQLSKCGLDGSLYGTVDKAVDDRTIGHNPERLSLLKGGIVYSNAVVTVSPTYLRETLCSGWLTRTLMQNREKYIGILNGIDTTIWNPATDAFLPTNYDAQKVGGKKICKHFVQKGFGLALEDTKNGSHVAGRVPLIVCITRLVAQKGLHLIRHAIKLVEQLGGQMIILGKASDAQVEREFEDLANSHNKDSDIRILLMYSEELSHMLYAAADMVLVPSIYEPCGLAQMIGMRYGAVPVVRKTGGLADTVFDMDDHSQPEMANGFVFEGIDEESLDGALHRAFSYYKEKPNDWNRTVQNVMKIDNSWNNTAGKYIDIYNSIRVK